MPVNRIVVVGGVAGGASAAAKARRTDEHAQITIFERGPYISFANCGLPYYIGGEITDRDDLILQTPESFNARFNVDVRTLHEVTAINRERKTVSVKNLRTGESSEQAYDKLILSPGAKAVVPAITGVDGKNIFTLKTVPDADTLKAFLAERKPKRAVVAGAGFIGLETAEGLVKLGIDTTVVELQDQVLPPLDADMAVYVSNHLRAAGLKLVLGDGIKAFNGGEFINEVELSSGKKMPADVVLLSVGVSPETALAANAGLTLGSSGSIEVNEFMQTSVPQVYAVGDVHGNLEALDRLLAHPGAPRPGQRDLLPLQRELPVIADPIRHPPNRLRLLPHSLPRIRHLGLGAMGGDQVASGLREGPSASSQCNSRMITRCQGSLKLRQLLTYCERVPSVSHNIHSASRCKMRLIPHWICPHASVAGDVLLRSLNLPKL